MAETSNRLGLIQRAAQRLKKNGGEGVVAPPSLHEAEPPAALLDSKQFSGSQKPLPAPHQFEDSFPPSTAKSVRLNLPQLRRAGMLTPDNLSTTISFEFRAIKRKLLVNARDPNSSVITRNMIMVTSALPGEGKTFTATNLALALAAERDIHVLLIDGDVIKPSIGTLFHPSSGRGLTDLLNGNCNDVSDIMHRCEDLPNLSVIFAGQRDPRTPELISSRRGADICLDLSKRYSDRVVIFDTPPVLASAEPANLAMHMHQTVMVVSSGAANRNQVERALEHISACPNISLIFNKAPKWHKMNNDSYYYYYGSTGARDNGAGGNGAGSNGADGKLSEPFFSASQ